MHFLQRVTSRISGFKAAAAAFLVSLFLIAQPALASESAFNLAGAQAEVLGYVALTTAFIVAVGIAVLGMIMIAKAVKWARRAG